MKRILLLLLVVQSLISCGERTESSEATIIKPDLDSEEKIMDAHTSENSLDWAGKYSGVLPCENCEGIDVILILNRDKTFQQKLRYLNASEETNLAGSFSWSEKGDKIKLKGGEGISEFKVKELSLLPLNEHGEEIKPVPGNNFLLLKE